MIENRTGEDRRAGTVSHEEILLKLVEHDDIIGQINEKLDPIAKGIGSIAFAFKGLLVLGAGSAAIVGILELINHVKA